MWCRSSQSDCVRTSGETCWFFLKENCQKFPRIIIKKVRKKQSKYDMIVSRLGESARTMPQVLDRCNMVQTRR